MATRTDSPIGRHAIGYALAAIAVVAVAWFVVGARQAHLVDAATGQLDNGAGQHAATTRHTESLLSSAAFLSPGTDLTLLRARLAMEQHDWTRAKRLVDDATASEPDNVAVWVSSLDLAVAHPSSADVARTLARLRTLDPIDAPAAEAIVRTFRRGRR
ncbi:MAG: hypothetical protein WAL22_05330 [Solirubrobacteraceae bacterium]